MITHLRGTNEFFLYGGFFFNKGPYIEDLSAVLFPSFKSLLPKWGKGSGKCPFNEEIAEMDVAVAAKVGPHRGASLTHWHWVVGS